MKQNGNGLKVASAVVIVLMGVLIFILAGFRSDVGEAKAMAVTATTACSTNSNRLTAVETDLKYIREDIRAIRQSVEGRGQ